MNLSASWQIPEPVRLLVEIDRLLADSPFKKLRVESSDRFSANPKLFAGSRIF